MSAPDPSGPLRPGDRVLVVHAPVPDRIQVLSTFPALAHALRARGVEARLASPYDLPFHPTDLQAPRPFPAWFRAWCWFRRKVLHQRDPIQHYVPPPDQLGHPVLFAEPEDRRDRLVDAFWDQLDPADADVAIVPGWGTARRLLDHPRLRPDTRLVVADFHLLEGAMDLAEARRPEGDRPSLGTWWPDAIAEVHACFEGYAGLYDNVGVPRDRLRWRPYPLAAGHFPVGPYPWRSRHAFAGGRHLRDVATLHAAARLLGPDALPIRAHATPDTGLDSIPPLVVEGEVGLDVFFETLRTARFVVIPLVPDAKKAAGISVLALAQAAGRPVVATDTPAMRDHVRDGVDGLLVPPGDPVALAGAIRRLTHDRLLLARLHRGALAAGARGSVAAWADALTRRA